MTMRLLHHTAIWLLAGCLAACGNPSGADNVAQTTTAVAPPSPAKDEPVSPPGSIYGEWVVADIRNDDGSRPDKANDPAWIGSNLQLTKELINLAPPPKGLHRPSGLDVDLANTCTKPIYRTDLENSASDLSSYKELYGHFGLPKPAEGRLYTLECNSMDYGGEEVTREDVAGPFLLFSYSPEKLIVAWSGGPIVLFQRRQ